MPYTLRMRARSSQARAATVLTVAMGSACGGCAFVLPPPTPGFVSVAPAHAYGAVGLGVGLAVLMDSDE